jgi:hypothetical protein
MCQNDALHLVPTILANNLEQIPAKISEVNYQEKHNNDHIPIWYGKIIYNHMFLGNHRNKKLDRSLSYIVLVEYPCVAMIYDSIKLDLPTKIQTYSFVIFLLWFRLLEHRQHHPSSLSIMCLQSPCMCCED